VTNSAWMQVPIPAGGHVPHTQRAYPGDGQKRNARWQKRWAEPSYVNECKRRCPTGQDIHVSGSGCTREAIRLAADPTIDVHWAGRCCAWHRRQSAVRRGRCHQINLRPRRRRRGVSPHRSTLCGGCPYSSSWWDIVVHLLIHHYSQPQAIATLC
jgi:hypothetical protein